ncbi:hypothetical protein [Marinobacter salexigens]|uniref:Uncharacterized protein n=1 Tax=Marinobacter salexigens TaxID=1925763 RepID=A0ABS6A5K4_9GAMM|nr:hypothetical protein [Marinobacter salexigens]MBU2872780.1 hypothetical protein [Marinobacter salexigens]
MQVAKKGLQQPSWQVGRFIVATALAGLANRFNEASRTRPEAACAPCEAPCPSTPN